MGRQRGIGTVTSEDAVLVTKQKQLARNATTQKREVKENGRLARMH